MRNCSDGRPGDEAEVLGTVRSALAGLLGVAPEAVPAAVPMRDQGADSALLVRLTAALADLLERPVPAWAVWQHPTPAALAAFLSGTPLAVAPARNAASAVTVTDDPIAVVGLGCRLPGGIDSPRGLWAALLSGTDAIGPVPPARWDGAAWYDADPAVPGRTTTRRGGFLDDVAGFDAAFFRTSPAEAEQMDPQQRITLEVAWSALEDARIVPERLAGSRAGVFLGSMWQEYHLATGADPAGIDSRSATGWDTSIIAARIAYHLGLQGPALSIGSACSSSLAAIHLAAHSLRRGESDLALAGGVSLMLHPHTTVAMTKFGGLNPAEQCRAFDAGAAGYVRGEGAGVVVLRRLADALRDGDRIYAVLHGSAMNNDGASNGITAPNPAAQVDVLRRAWRHAGIDPARVSYVEAHGTGTPLGDPIEADALGEVFGPGRTDALLLGSAKTNFGHLEPAAGVLGVLKTALALYHGELPASLHFETPNPLIDFVGRRLEVVAARRAWPAGDRYAGVSGFGFGGTNVHLALGAGPPRRRPAPPPTGDRTGAGPPVVFCFSGHGGQWAGMGRDLLPDPVFRAALAEADDALAAELDWSVLDEIAAGGPRLDRTDVIQPVLFALQVAYARTLAADGVTPGLVLGQSVGEVAAAVVAGVLSLRDGARLIARWSALIAERAAGTGGLIVVMTTAAQAAELVGDALDVAGEPAPDTCCLSGPAEAVAAAERTLADAGVRTHRVAIDYPSHSGLLAALGPDLLDRLGELRPAPGAIPFVSAVTGAELPGTALTAGYWVRNMCEPMRLADAVRALPAGAVLVEVGPHPVLAGSVPGMLVVGRRGRPGPQALDELLDALRDAGVPVVPPPGPAVPLPWVLSGRTEAALRDQAVALREHLGPEARPVDIGWSLATTRSAFGHRAVLVGRDDDLAAGLSALAAGRDALGLTTGVVTGGGPPGGNAPVMVFPGQGGQWRSMATDLLRESPIFAARYGACAEALAPFTDADLVAALGDDEALARVDVVQPVLWAVMVSLAELWRAHGVRPAAVVGHSQGEIAAATVAGALSLADGARVVALRSRVIAARLAGHGGMVSLALSREETSAFLTPWAGRLCLAVVNGPAATVVSGDPEAIGELIDRCRAEGVRARRLPVDYASHCSAVDAARDEIIELLAPVRPRSAEVPLVSTVTGELMDTAGMDAAYWFRSLRRPVEFQAATERLTALGHRAFIEVSPHPVLIMGIQAAAPEAVVTGTLRRHDGGLRRFLGSAAEAYVRGVDVDWTAALPGGRPVDLPAYRFQRRAYWLTADRPRPAEPAEDTAFWAAVEAGDLAGLAATLNLDPRAGLAETIDGMAAWRRRRLTDAAVRDCWYGLRWTPIPEPAAAPAQTWLALVPPGDEASEVLRGLDGAGLKTVQVVHGTGDLAGACAEAARDHVIAGVVSLLPAVGGVTDPPVAGLPLWCITRGGLVAAMDDPAPAPGAEPPPGVAVIDLPAGPAPAGCWTGVAAALAGATGERHLAVRAGGLLARRLVRVPVPDGVPWRPHGTVLVAGTGDLADTIARGLSDQGADVVRDTGREDDCHDADPARLTAVVAVGDDAAAAGRLHELTASTALDAFVLCSSVGAALGLATAGLDALAERRRATGLPATVVALGAAGEPHLRELPAGIVVPALCLAVPDTRGGLVLADADWDRAPRDTVLAGLQPGEEPETADLCARLAGMPAAARSEAVLQVVFRHVGAVLGHDGRFREEPGVPFRDLGFDSVTGVSLAGRLSAETGLSLPPTLIFEQPTPAALAAHLLAEMAAAEQPAPGAQDDPDGLAAMLLAANPDGLNADQIDRLRDAVRHLDRALAAAVAAPPDEPMDDLTDDELFRMLDDKLGTDVAVHRRTS
ncbi:MAG: acyltransferase domain-containing protein [Actinomycetota bacterium]|nr:acyltransferase domain-containing protein [Actinomycetota bacterium]